MSGTKPDGSTKVRPIDDMTRCVLFHLHVFAVTLCAHLQRSGCNAATAPSEKLAYESMDRFLQSIQAMEKTIGKNLSFWKADLDSAFRRIPIRPKDREFSHVVFKYNENVIVAKHLATMFGSVASVHHWERVGIMPLLALPVT